jgi:hypothetical protein
MRLRRAWFCLKSDANRFQLLMMAIATVRLAKFLGLKLPYGPGIRVVWHMGLAN